MKSFNVTISRAHKIVERLKKRAEEQAALARNSFTMPMIQAKPLPAQVVAYHKRVEEGRAALKVFQVIQKEIADIRNKIAHANVTYGMSDKMAEQERLRHERALLEQVLSANTENDALSLEVVMDKAFEMPNSNPSDGIYPVRRQGIKVMVCEASDIEEWKACVLQIDAVRSRLSDEISDLNASKIEISLSDDSASAAGLV